MLQRSAGGRLLEVILFTLASLVLYHSGIGFALFLIPLQVVASRRGVGPLLLACGIFMLVFAALRLVPPFGGALAPDILSVVETLFVVVLFLALFAVNLPLLGGGRGRALYRLVGATAGAGLVSVPILFWLSGSAQYQAAMGAIFNEVSKGLTSLFSRSGEMDSVMSTLLAPEALRRMSDAYLSRSLLAIFFVLLSFSWWAGQASASRSLPPGRTRFRFSGFHLESFWLWPLIAAFALILADLFLGNRGPARNAAAGGAVGASPVWAYAAWNVGIVMMILYGLQGLAIVRFQFEKHGLPRLLWLLLLVGLLVLAASPRVGLFVIVALPVFGASETWIRYRVPVTREPDESH